MFHRQLGWMQVVDVAVDVVAEVSEEGVLPGVVLQHLLLSKDE
jgi:hypothetical protein